jgi:hypothetical protein
LSDRIEDKLGRIEDGIEDGVEDKLDAMPPRRLLMLKCIAVVLWTVFFGLVVLKMGAAGAFQGLYRPVTLLVGAYVFGVAFIFGGPELADRVFGRKPKKWGDGP